MRRLAAPEALCQLLTGLELRHICVKLQVTGHDPFITLVKG